MRAFSTGEYRIEVRMGAPRQDALSVRLHAPDGRLLHTYDEQVEASEGTARAIYQALMAAMAAAIRDDCRCLTVDFAPSGLLELVRTSSQAELGLADRNLQRWMFSQLELFDHVWMHGRPLKKGVVPASVEDRDLHDRLFRGGTA